MRVACPGRPPGYAEGMTTLSQHIEQIASVVVARPEEGQLTHVAMQELATELMERVRYNGAHHVVLDLSQVEFMASACLGVLVGFMQDIEPNKGRIALAACQPNVAFVFKVTKLDTVFAMFDEVDEAVADLQGK